MLKKIILNIAFWCDKYLKWHNCDIQGNDGMSNYGICKYCGAKCLQDSQGNWFALERKNCRTCKNNKTMNCPNSKECYNTQDKPYYTKR